MSIDGDFWQRLTNTCCVQSMWEKTLVVMSSDNGGPVDLAENAANNWPKRGGKYSLFEGGISVAAFVSGGYLSKKVQGTVNNGIVHIADWYSTFLGLAKIDPTDKRAAAAVPAIPPIVRAAVCCFLSVARAAPPLWPERPKWGCAWAGLGRRLAPHLRRDQGLAPRGAASRRR